MPQSPEGYPGDVAPGPALGVLGQFLVPKVQDGHALKDAVADRILLHQIDSARGPFLKPSLPKTPRALGTSPFLAFCERGSLTSRHSRFSMRLVGRGRAAANELGHSEGPFVELH